MLVLSFSYDGAVEWWRNEETTPFLDEEDKIWQLIAFARDPLRSSQLYTEEEGLVRLEKVKFKLPPINSRYVTAFVALIGESEQQTIMHSVATSGSENDAGYVLVYSYVIAYLLLSKDLLSCTSFPIVVPSVNQLFSHGTILHVRNNLHTLTMLSREPAVHSLWKLVDLFYQYSSNLADNFLDVSAEPQFEQTISDVTTTRETTMTLTEEIAKLKARITLLEEQVSTLIKKDQERATLPAPILDSVPQVSREELNAVIEQFSSGWNSLYAQIEDIRQKLHRPY